MQGAVITAGPFLWVFFGAMVLVCVAALYLVLDALRRRPDAFARVPETRWPYVAVGVVYAAAYAAWWFAAVRASQPWVGHVVLFGAVVVVAATASYLLRVVFPKRPPAGGAAPDAADGPPGDGTPEEPPR